MCVCLSVREDIAGTTRAISTKFFVLCMLLMAMARSSSGGVTIPQRERAILGENVAAHCKIMGHSTVRGAKTAEAIEMPF